MERKKLETILVLVLACIVFYLLFKKPYWLVAGLGLGTVGIFFPYAAGLIHSAWMGLAHALGFVMGRVVLSLIYFVFLLPLSFAARALRKTNGINLKRKDGSYYTERHVSYSKETMEHTW